VGSRYSAALEVAAGARLQSIVAARDEDAAHAIEYLKRSQIGRATFLPLNKLDKGNLSSKPNHSGVVDYALNLVDFDPKFKPAFWYVFRDTLVVETLSHARALMGRYRLVTLEGDLVEKSGAMTGGHYRSKMKFAAEEQKKLAELSEKISAADQERSARLDKLDRIEEQISILSREVEELNKAISKKTFRLDELAASRPRLEKSIQERRERLVQMESGFLSCKEQLSILEAEIKNSDSILGEEQQKIETLEGELKGSQIPLLNKQVDTAQAEIRRLQERLNGIDAEILKDKIREESDKEKLQELLARREALESQKAVALQRKDAAAVQIQTLQEQLSAMQAREAKIEVELHGLKGREESCWRRPLLCKGRSTRRTGRGIGSKLA